MLATSTMSGDSVSASRIFNIAGYSIDPNQPAQRQPPRPVSMQDESYKARFDYDTLFFDAIHNKQGRQVRIICPKLLNLLSAVAGGRFVAVPQGTLCKAVLRDLDRQTQILVAVPEGTESLDFTSAVGSFRIQPTTADATFLAGERVVMTAQKDNRLRWIRDWARFYQEVHGATAFCIYDNASARYDVRTLRDCVLNACPNGKVVVVRWPFKYGPVGVGKKNYWDSNFCQLGAFEHARWTHLQSARSVLNCDIDELVLSRGDKSVFERAETSRSGVVAFFGDWVVGIDGMTDTEQDAEELSFADFTVSLRRRSQSRYVFFKRFPMRCAPKWAMVPSRCPRHAQWHVHKVAGWLPSRLINRDLIFRHFREISTSWKYARTGRPAFDTDLHVEDPELLAAYRRMRWLDRG